MIAKLVVWDESRQAALWKLRQKLNEYHVSGRILYAHIFCIKKWVVIIVWFKNEGVSIQLF